MRAENNGNGEDALLTAAGRILSSDLINTLERADINAVMQDCVDIMNSDASHRTREAYMNILYRIAFREDMSLEECWQIYRDIDRMMFVDFSMKLQGGSLDELYRTVYEFVRSQLDYTGLDYREPKERNSKLAVVVTSQLLRIGHAPTRRVLDYSYVLQHDLGYKVVIINDGGMHYYHCDTMRNDIEFTFINEYSDMTSIEHRGESFELLQVGALMPDLGVLQQLIETIYALNPMFVYNIGASCLTSDLCDSFTTVASLPCSFNRPVATCRNLILGREPAEADHHLPCELLPGQRLVESVFNYTFAEPEEQHEPADFVPAEDIDGGFLACSVGYRLGAEINEEFVDIIASALERIPRMYMFLVGDIPADSPVHEMLARRMNSECRKRVIMTGGLRGAASLISKTHLMLNPDRSGGGRSIFEACHYGVPVVSFRRGDGYHACGSAFGVDDSRAYVEQIVKYATDPELYAQMSARAIKRAAVLDDMTKTQQLVTERILE